MCAASSASTNYCVRRGVVCVVWASPRCAAGTMTAALAGRSWRPSMRSSLLRVPRHWTQRYSSSLRPVACWWHRWVAATASSCCAFGAPRTASARKCWRLWCSCRCCRDWPDAFVRAAVCALPGLGQAPPRPGFSGRDECCRSGDLSGAAGCDADPDDTGATAALGTLCADLYRGVTDRRSARLRPGQLPARCAVAVDRAPGLGWNVCAGTGSVCRVRVLDRVRGRIHADSLQRSEEHTSELQSLMRISYAVFCLKKKSRIINIINTSNISIIERQLMCNLFTNNINT